MNNNYAIQVKNLSVDLESQNILYDVEMNIHEKDFLAIIGPNGAGKTTLLKTILGLIEPKTGEIKIFGERLGNAKTPVGYVPQYSKFDKTFPISVYDTVLSGRLKTHLNLFHKYLKDDKEKTIEILKELDLYHLKNKQIGKISGGQLQRVLIARALVNNPKILLLDEPTASIDENSKVELYELLKKLNENMTIIVVSHDIGVVSMHVKSIACLNKTLHFHGDEKIDGTVVDNVYGCPVDFIAHGIPHRVLKEH